MSQVTKACSHWLTNSSLAKAELYLTIATIFRRYDHQELFKTTRKDVELKYDMFMPQPDMSSKGVSVLFK
jgi:hypothetical protein